MQGLADQKQAEPIFCRYADCGVRLGKRTRTTIIRGDGDVTCTGGVASIRCPKCRRKSDFRPLPPTECQSNETPREQLGEVLGQAKQAIDTAVKLVSVLPLPRQSGGC